MELIPNEGTKMETLSYYIGKEREIEIGEEYYLGQLWDGSGDVEDIIEEDGQGCVWVGDDEDGTPVIVGFTYEELDQERLMDTVVTVTDIF